MFITCTFKQYKKFEKFEKMNFTVHNFILDLPIGVLFKYGTFSSKVYSA